METINQPTPMEVLKWKLEEFEVMTPINLDALTKDAVQEFIDDNADLIDRVAQCLRAPEVKANSAQLYRFPIEQAIPACEAQIRSLRMTRQKLHFQELGA